MMLCCTTVLHGQDIAEKQFTTDSVALPSKYGGIVVSAQIDDDSIIVGEQTLLHIKVEGADGKRVVFPSEKDLTRGAIEALEGKSDTMGTGAESVIERSVVVTSFDAGRHTVDNVIVSIEDGGSVVRLMPDGSLVLDVSYAADADTAKCEVKPDNPYIKEPYTLWEIVRWLVLALIVAAIAVCIVWVVKRRKEHKPIVVLPGAKPAPADKKALSELESLRRKELWQKGRIKRYYTDMTDIVRRFLRNMYGINAAEMTTRQTLKAFHGIADWNEESENLLRQLLQKADMVKFAKSQPEAYEHDLAMQNAVDFVRKVAELHRINNPEEESGKKERSSK